MDSEISGSGITQLLVGIVLDFGGSTKSTQRQLRYV